MARDVLARARAEGMPGAADVSVRHGLAEDTREAAASADVVTMCLVMHELPARISQEIMREAFRCAAVASACTTCMGRPRGAERSFFLALVHLDSCVVRELRDVQQAKRFGPSGPSQAI